MCGCKDCEDKEEAIVRCKPHCVDVKLYARFSAPFLECKPHCVDVKFVPVFYKIMSVCKPHCVDVKLHDEEDNILNGCKPHCVDIKIETFSQYYYHQHHYDTLQERLPPLP